MLRQFRPSLCRTLQRRWGSTETRIEELGHTLPAVGSPKGSYVQVTRVGNLLYTAGHLPTPAGGEIIIGKVGADLTAEEANKAASYVALQLLATIKNEIGELDNIKQIVKLVGFVNCTDDFTQQPSVCKPVTCAVLSFALAAGNQRLLRSTQRGARGERNPRPLCSWHKLTPFGHSCRDRGDCRSQVNAPDIIMPPRQTIVESQISQ